MHQEKQDLQGIEDIRIMVDEFYAKVRLDELLAPVFYERIRDKWQPHLETMYRFWNAALFAEKGYVGNPFSKHVSLPLTAGLFRQWLHLFNATVDDHFSGPLAESAKTRAAIMADSFIRRFEELGGKASDVIV